MTLTEAATAERSSAARVTPAELAFVAAIFLVGLALRAAWPSRLAVEHFDEGVYASNVFFDSERGEPHYPNQHLYAPPLVPLLIEFPLVLLGFSNAAAMSATI